MKLVYKEFTKVEFFFYSGRLCLEDHPILQENPPSLNGPMRRRFDVERSVVAPVLDVQDSKLEEIRFALDLHQVGEIYKELLEWYPDCVHRRQANLHILSRNFYDMTALRRIME